MRLGYTILYVADVDAALTFWEQAFGLERRFLHPSGTYGELATGDTTLAFAALSLAEAHFAGGVEAADPKQRPQAAEIGLVTEDVAGAHARALAAGAQQLAVPATMPWGQTVSWVRCPAGELVELCTPMGG